MAKAAAHLDDGADRLARLADELRQADSAPDNSMPSDALPDNSPNNSPAETEDALPAEASHLALAARAAFAQDRHDEGELILDALAALRPASALFEGLRVLDNITMKPHVPYFFRRAATDAPLGVIVELITMLWDAGHTDDAEHVAAFAGQLRSFDDALTLVSELHDGNLKLLVLSTAMPLQEPLRVRDMILWLRVGSHDTPVYRLLAILGRSSTPTRLVEVVQALRDVEHNADAYQLLAAIGREREAQAVPPVLTQLGRSGQQSDVDWVIKAARQRDEGVQPLIHALRQAGYHDDVAKLQASYDVPSHGRVSASLPPSQPEPHTDEPQDVMPEKPLSYRS
ncbi:hypothetical protein ABZ746_38440 [Streptomyces sp. NPDC020096]